jgi:hypothetical protein
MSEAEQPQRLTSGHQVTVEDVRQLMGASTPHFALQIRNRIRRLIAPLPPDHPARIEGEREIARLEALAVDGEERGEEGQPGERPLPSLADEPPF